MLFCEFQRPHAYDSLLMVDLIWNWKSFSPLDPICKSKPCLYSHGDDNIENENPSMEDLM